MATTSTASPAQMSRSPCSIIFCRPDRSFSDRVRSGVKGSGSLTARGRRRNTIPARESGNPNCGTMSGWSGSRPLNVTVAAAQSTQSVYRRTPSSALRTSALSAKRVSPSTKPESFGI